MVIVGLFTLMAVFAEWVAPYPPTAISLAESLRPPIWQGGTSAHILGTDKLGRDILSRIIYGARVSLAVAAISIGIAGFVGAAAGILAGYHGGWCEIAIMRVVDVALSIPTILLALALGTIWGPSLNNVMIIIILTLWAFYARQAHANALSLRERDYVTASRASGASTIRILARHVFPNMINSLIVLATLQVAVVVLMEAALSFLGVGIPPPTPAWGLMVAEGRELLETAWWVSSLPGIALSLVVLSANMVGDWIRDYYDPTLRHISA